MSEEMRMVLYLISTNIFSWWCKGDKILWFKVGHPRYCKVREPKLPRRSGFLLLSCSIQVTRAACIQQWIWLSKGRSLQAIRLYLSGAISVTNVHILGLWTGNLNTGIKLLRARIKIFVIQKGLEFTATQTMEMYCNP